MATEEYRARSYATWEAMAPGWERRRAMLWEVARPVAEWLINRLEPEPGDVVLELAAGPGDAGFLAAPLVGESGRVISTDFSPAMVDVARRRGAALGLTNVEYRVLDAEKMDVETDSVDGVVCKWGYMLMADPAAAFAETRRVLRAGGRLCFSVWAEPERNPWLLMSRLLVERGYLPPPEPGVPGACSMASAERIGELVTAAGFSAPAVEEMDVVWRFSDFDDYMGFATELAGAVAMALAPLPADEVDSIARAAEREAAPFAVDGGYVMPGVCLNVVTS